MQNLMKQIVEIDHKAQEITNSAQQEKVDSKRKSPSVEKKFEAVMWRKPKNRLRKASRLSVKPPTKLGKKRIRKMNSCWNK